MHTVMEPFCYVAPNTSICDKGLLKSTGTAMQYRSPHLDPVATHIVRVLMAGHDGEMQRLGFTSRTLGAFIEELGLPLDVLHGLALPACRWLHERGGHEIETTVIDTGPMRLRLDIAIARP